MVQTGAEGQRPTGPEEEADTPALWRHHLVLLQLLIKTQQNSQQQRPPLGQDAGLLGNGGTSLLPSQPLLPPEQAKLPPRPPSGHMQPRLAPRGHSVGTMQVMSWTQCQKMAAKQHDKERRT